MPYSLHAPYEELRAIVRALAPVAVVGNTKPPRSPDAPAIDPEAFFSRLLSDPRGSEDDEDDDEDEKSDDAGFLDGKENDGDGHGIVRVFDAGPAKKAAPRGAEGDAQTHRASSRRAHGARGSAPGRPGRKPARSRSPPAPDPSPSGNDDDDDDDEGAADADAAASPSASIAPTASGDSNGCSLDATLDATETARIRDDPGVDSCLSATTSARANDDRLRERRRAVALRARSSTGDGEGAGWRRRGETSGEGGGAKASDGDGGDGRRSAGDCPRVGRRARVGARERGRGGGEDDGRRRV